MSRKSRKFFYERDNFFAREILLLPMLTGKNVNSVLEFVKTKSWLLRIFLICLHNQLKFHNPSTPGNRTTPGSRGAPGPLGNLVPLCVEPQDTMVPVSTRALERSKFTVIKSNNLLQHVYMITYLCKFKFHTSSKILFLSKQSKGNCSRSELALP